MAVPNEESIQESLERLNKAQSNRTLKDTGRPGAQRERDQNWALHLVVGFVYGLIIAFVGKLIASSAVPDSVPDLIGSIVFALGCAAMIASTLATAAWMIVDFPRWRRAYGSVQDPPTMNDDPPTIPSGVSSRRSWLSRMNFSGFSGFDGGGGDFGGGGDCGGGC